MRKSNWTPSIVPRDDDQNVYLVMDDSGKARTGLARGGCEGTDLETIILDLLEGQ
jgi:hypothetical protein